MTRFVEDFGQALAAIRTEIPGPNSLALQSTLKAVEAPTVTYLHPKFPIFYRRAHGANVEDVDGNIYVDFTSAFGVAALGHSHPAIVEAIQKQAEELPHGMGDVHPPVMKVALLEALAAVVPMSNAQTILSSSGAEAVESALKTAFLYTKCPGVLSFQDSYHGLTMGALNTTGSQRFRKPFQKLLAPLTTFVPFPAENASIERSIRLIEKKIDHAKKTKNPIGAVLVEPIQGRAGVRVPPKGWLSALRTLTKQKKILLIVDEIFTGFGRTGQWFAVNDEFVIPDMLCVGKALSGTMPLSACIGSQEVMRAWPRSAGEALHTSTFLGNPLGCAAALATLRILREKNIIEEVKILGTKYLETIEKWKQNIKCIRAVRGRGYMIGIELASRKKGFGFEVTQRALQKGLIVLPSGPNGNILSLTPPLTTTSEQWEFALSTLYGILHGA